MFQKWKQTTAKRALPPIISIFSQASAHNSSRSKGFLPFPKRQILDYSKLKEFADDNFKLAENGIKFSK